MKQTLASLLGTLFIIFGLAKASAQTSVSVLGVETVDSPAILAGQLAAELKAYISQTAGYDLVPGKALAEIKLVFQCDDESPECMAKAGAGLKANKLLWGDLAKQGDKYVLSLKMLDIDTVSMIKVDSKEMSAEEVADVRNAVLNLVKRLLPPVNGEIKLSCNEIGADVFLDNRKLDKTTIVATTIKDIPVGVHVVEVKRDGFLPWAKQVQVTGGSSVELNVSLTQAIPETQLKLPPLPPPPPPIVETRTGWKIAFWSGVAVTVSSAVVALVGGLQISKAEDDKVAEIYRLVRLVKNSREPERDDITNIEKITDPNSSDVCKFSQGKYPELYNICNRGKNWATATNILIGTTAASAVVSTFLLYKAYFSKSASSVNNKKSPSEEDPGFSWQFVPVVGEHGVNLGLQFQF